MRLPNRARSRMALRHPQQRVVRALCALVFIAVGTAWANTLGGCNTAGGSLFDPTPTVMVVRSGGCEGWMTLRLPAISAQVPFLLNNNCVRLDEMWQSWGASVLCQESGYGSPLERDARSSDSGCNQVVASVF